MNCRGAAHLHGCAAPCRPDRRSPGSRGLYRARSKPSSLGSMPQPPDGSGPLSPERPELLEMIAQATSMDSPTMLLDLASSLLAANEIAQQQSPDVASIHELGIETLDSV